MKTFLIFVSAVCLSHSAFASDVVLKCTSPSKSSETSKASEAMTITIHSAQPESAITITSLVEGNAYSHDDSFSNYSSAGSEVSYSDDDVSTFTLPTDLITGKISSAAITYQVEAFSGGPGEAGWPSSTQTFNCSK